MKALTTKSPSETSGLDDQKSGPPLPSFLSNPPRWPPPPPKLQFGSNSSPFGLPSFPNGSTPNLENKFPMSPIEDSTSDSIPPMSALEKFSPQASGKISPPLTTECVPTPSIKKNFSPFDLPPLPKAKLTTTTAPENTGFGEASETSPKAGLSPQKSISPPPKSGFPSPPHLPKLRSPSDLLPPPPNLNFKPPPAPSPPSLPTLKPPPPPTVTIINNINLPPIPNEILPQRAGGSFLGKFFFFFIRSRDRQKLAQILKDYVNNGCAWFVDRRQVSFLIFFILYYFVFEMVEHQELFHLRILNGAKNYDNSVALIEAETGETLTFSDLRRKSYQLAEYFRKNFDPKIGEVFICFMPNDIHYPIIFLAGAILGCSLTGISPECTDEELQRYVTQTRSSFIFTTSELVDVVSKIDIANKVHIFVIDKQENQLGIDLEAAIQDIKPDFTLHETISLSQEDVLLTPLSSGTTGAPKCVMLTHRNFNAATDILKSEIFDNLSSDGGRRTTIAVLPFYHGSGFWALCYCLLEGHSSVVMKNFQAPLMLSCIEDYKVDTLNIVPSIINFLLKNDAQLKEFDISSIKTVLCGSAPIGKDLIKKFLAKFSHVEKFLQVAGYGMTEVVILSHITPLDSMLDDEKHLGSCGKLLPGFEARIVDDESGVECNEPGMRGELWLKSDCVMKGYLYDEIQTAEAIDQDGWYHTGDVVYFDQDGYYYVVDRVKDLIKVNGLQVSPVELERVILTHPRISDAAVVGVPDPERGEVPRAYIILHLDSGDEHGTIIEEIRKFVHDRIAPYKQLRGGIYAVDELPRSPSGKILRRELKKLVELTAETIL